MLGEPGDEAMVVIEWAHLSEFKSIHKRKTFHYHACYVYVYTCKQGGLTDDHLPIIPVMTAPMPSVSLNICVTLAGSRSLSGTFFWVIITAESTPRTPIEVVAPWLMALNAYSGHDTNKKKINQRLIGKALNSFTYQLGKADLRGRI